MIQRNTKMLYADTTSNVELVLIDLDVVGIIGKKRRIEVIGQHLGQGV